MSTLWQQSPPNDAPDSTKSAPSPLDLISTSKTRHRNRDYEKSHAKFSYRLTDGTIPGQILGIAQSHSISADNVARAFVQAGLHASQQGKIDWSGIRPVQGRMTLFPTGQETWVVHDEPVTWAQEIPQPQKRRRKTEAERAQERKARDLLRVHYRWPPEINEALEQLTRQVMGYQPGEHLARKDGRKGEVLTILLRFGIQAYQAGRIDLTPKLWSL